MADYPDWTDLVQVVGSDIMVPIDVQGAYIMLPVDIQGQYLTLDIDIAAQSVGNIEVDIAAQSVGNIAVSIAASAVTLNINIQSSEIALNVNIAASKVTLPINIKSSEIALNVNISAQSIGNLTIDIQAQSVGVYLQPEWAAKQGIDKNIRGLANDEGWGGSLKVAYTVPEGKTLYITLVTAGGRANEEANGSKIQNIRVVLFNQTTETFVLETAGEGGVVVPLAKPVVVGEEEEINLFAYSYAAHNSNLYGTIMGYEV